VAWKHQKKLKSNKLHTKCLFPLLLKITENLAIRVPPAIMSFLVFDCIQLVGSKVHAIQPTSSLDAFPEEDVFPLPLSSTRRQISFHPGQNPNSKDFFRKN